MKEIINVNALEKSFQNKQVVKKISFTMEEGEILCLLGPNGAGKSTTINILSGVLGMDGGQVNYQGKDIRTCRKEYQHHIGVVPQDLALYEDLSAIANIRFFASLYGLSKQKLEERVQEALALSGLQDRAKEKVKTFSGGMKRRLNIACAIAHHPQLVIMDEPTVGIDPQSRNHILDSIRKLRELGTSILYTTHYMEEVEEISTRILIMDHGEIIAQGTKETLKEEVSNRRRFLLEVEDTQALSLDEFYAIEGVKDVSIKEHTILLSTLKHIENLDRIIITAMKQNMKIQNINCQNASLEQVFLELTGRSLRD